ncbi:hypothetical protein VTN77DRAFT_3982 [Rasamsonia byssochlamydoides]|uniref:uncharacterized protein n=1 Tax=Rasamsonia byssochlamydoides TaxID=89139 RepID=UPI0037423A45
MASMEIKTHSDDETHLKAKNFLEGLRVMHDGSKRFGKEMNSIATWKEKMERAGFENVVKRIDKLPQNTCPKDPKLRDPGLLSPRKCSSGAWNHTPTPSSPVSLADREKKSKCYWLECVVSRRICRFTLYTNVYFVNCLWAEAIIITLINTYIM